MNCANGSSIRPKPKTLYIENNWAVDDLTTVAECDLAANVLTAAIISIEESLKATR